MYFFSLVFTLFLVYYFFIMLVYKKDVLEKLKENGFNTTRLRREKLLTESTIQDLRNGKVVGIIALEKICAMLNMQPGDLIEYKRG